MKVARLLFGRFRLVSRYRFLRYFSLIFSDFFVEAKKPKLGKSGKSVNDMYRAYIYKLFFISLNRVKNFIYFFFILKSFKNFFFFFFFFYFFFFLKKIFFFFFKVFRFFFPNFNLNFISIY